MASKTFSCVAQRNGIDEVKLLPAAPYRGDEIGGLQ
jgi:hypothetical protein